MELEFLGHACVAIHHADCTLVVDPYDTPLWGDVFRYAPVDVQADWVVCTHEHLDHSARHVLGPDVREVREGRAGPFAVRRAQVWHDEYRGARRGGASDVVEIDDGEFRVVHLGDVGCSPVPDVIGSMRNPDVLLVPVGGVFTCGAAQAWEWTVRLRPAVVIPIHYRTTATSLAIRGPETFLAWRTDWKEIRSRRLSLKKGDRGCWRVDASRVPGDPRTDGAA